MRLLTILLNIFSGLFMSGSWNLEQRWHVFIFHNIFNPFVTIVHLYVHSLSKALISSPNVIWNSWLVGNLSGHMPTLTNQQQADILHTARVMTSQSWKFWRNENNIYFIIESTLKLFFSHKSFLKSVFQLKSHTLTKYYKDVT